MARRGGTSYQADQKMGYEKTLTNYKASLSTNKDMILVIQKLNKHICES
jgi:hypothetical protein